MAMTIDEFKNACELFGLFSAKEKATESKNIGKFVLVRTYSAGIHCGFLVSECGKVVELKDARRVWRWRGANTLNELSQNGCDKEYSRISEAVPSISLTESIEIIPCSVSAFTNLSESRWGK